jgi:hypothetical protein
MAKDKKADKAKAKAKESKKSKKPAADEDAPKKKGFPPKKGDGKSKPKAKKKPLPVFKAPDEFKPFFAKVSVKIAKDGIIDDVQVIRIKGSPNNENAKTVDLGLWDTETLRRFAIRYAGAAFIKSDKKRIAGPSMAQMIMRVGANKETGALKVSFKDIKFKAGKEGKAKMLDKKDPIYRALRKPARLVPGAFTKVKPFPSAADLKALLKAQDEE